jgi:glycosyltransferase involved in cell wall biosynthesis
MVGREQGTNLDATVAEAQAQVQVQVQVQNELAAIGSALEGHTDWIKAIEQGLADLRIAHTAQLRDLGRWIAAMGAELGGQTDWTKAIEQGLADLRIAHTEQLRDLGRWIAAMGAELKGHTDWTKAIEQGLADLRIAHTAQLRDLDRWIAATVHTIGSLSSAPVIPWPTLQASRPPARLVDERVALARAVQVWMVVRWLDQAPIESSTLISVVLTTRNRRAYLERAIASVLAQRHFALELVVIDDGSTDDTAELLAAILDPRVRVLRTAGIGVSAARNLGLAAARGKIITHLDDDNLMDPGWLRAVAWAFERWPDTELLYGARLIEDAPARGSIPSGVMPSMEWLPFDRARLEQANYIDMNVIAHRADLPEARFDEALRSSVEWDMLLRLTARRSPLELPVIACLYSNYAPNRVSEQPAVLEDSRIVRARLHTTRSMRVLSYNALFPLMSETYIEEEMLALEAQGACVAFSAFERSISPYSVRQAVFSGLEEAIAVHDPDVIVVYWTTHALGELEHLERVGRPFALRVHSFDFDVDEVIRVKNHPCCVGVWAFPHHAAAIPGAHELVPIFMTHAAMPAPATKRNVVASVSAGLPKKDWPLLLDAMDRLSDLDRVIVLARSNSFEHVPDEVVRLAATCKRPPTVRINVPRSEVFELLTRTSVLLYTAMPGVPLGIPMSVIEGLYAGACVITPDRPEMSALCGEGFRPYRTAADIVAHVREVMAGGPAIEAERQHNHESALARFCDPQLSRRFHAELSAAVTAWRLRA